MGVELGLLSELETSNSANSCLFISSRSWRVCSTSLGSHGKGGRSSGLLMGLLAGIPSMGINLHIGGFCFGFKVCW